MNAVYRVLSSVYTVVAQRKFCSQLITILLIIHLVTVNSNGCFQRVYQSTSVITYRARVSHTVTYECGLWGWSRCSRDIYMRESLMRYTSISRPTCCLGHKLNQHQDACLPICQDCISPKRCTAPGVCECSSGFSGLNCNNPVCENCSPLQRCIAPNQCECHSGFSGTDCSSDIDECQTDNGGCDHICNNTDGSYICSCQQQFMLASDQLSCIGTLNSTWIILGNGTLTLKWENPIWDTRSIVKRVKINCSNSNYEIIANQNIVDSMIILVGLNLNATITCCHTLMTVNETGPQECDEYHQRSEANDKMILPVEASPTTITEHYDRTSSEQAPASSNYSEATIAGGVSGAILLLLLLAFIIVTVLIICGVLKRKTDDSTSISIQNEHVYSVTFHHGHGSMDDQNCASKAECQYDSLRFEINNDGAKIQMLNDCDSEYSHLRH